MWISNLGRLLEENGGTGKDQTGGWIYNILPYMSRCRSIFYMLPSDGNPTSVTATQKAGATKMVPRPRYRQ